MKKIQKLLVVSLAIMLFNFANALEIIDVKANHWASQEIVHSIQNGFLEVIDGNKFKPESSITRGDFVTALLKVIRRQNELITQGTSFKDINNSTPNKKSVVLSEQIRMAFGYPDKTFKPLTPIDHNETMSMISNITNSDYIAADITPFNDYKQIPLWAKRAYIKNVANGLYVNYPEPLTFNPTNNLTRAEAAVLFDKLRANLDKVQDKYRDLYDSLPDDNDLGQGDDGLGFNKSVFMGNETLNLAPFARNHQIAIYDNKKIIEAGNILIGTSLNEVKARKDLVGHEYAFVAPNDVYSTQGTFLYPKGTEFYARVEKLGYSAWRSRPEKSNVVFHKYSLPNGETYDMAGVPFTKDDKKVVYVKNNLKPAKNKPLEPGDKNTNKHLIKVAHQNSPLMEFDIKNNKTIYILLTGDMVIPQNEEYMNLRTKRSILEEDI